MRRGALALLFLAACSRDERPIAVRDLAKKDATIAFDEDGRIVVTIDLDGAAERKCPVLRSAAISLNGAQPRDLKPGGKGNGRCEPFVAIFERLAGESDAHFVIDDASGKAFVDVPGLLAARTLRIVDHAPTFARDEHVGLTYEPVSEALDVVWRRPGEQKSSPVAAVSRGKDHTLDVTGLPTGDVELTVTSSLPVTRRDGLGKVIASSAPPPWIRIHIDE